MTTFPARLAKIRAARWLAELLALAAAGVYSIQAFASIHLLPSTLDEGNYLYKGLLFAQGVYRPFQDYGPWTNKMPLAFLIPGWAQVLFGAGLRSARIFAVALSLLMLLGIYLVVRRLGGRWWAAAAVASLAFNPGLIQMYSQALSEGLVAFMLAWVLVLVLGPGRPLWQLMAGSALAGLVVMTRQNMLPLVAFVVLYIGWEYGWKKGLYSALAAGAVLLAFHVYYWPGIMRIWAPWLPFKLPFLAGAGGPAAQSAAQSTRLVSAASLLALPARADAPLSVQTGRGLLQLLLSAPAAVLQSLKLQSGDLLAGLYPFWDALRYYFVPIFGTITAWLLAARKRIEWKSPAHFRAAAALSILLVVLFVSHLWAALGNDYCVYCFSIYLSFFSLIGLVIVAASAGTWRLRLPLPVDLLAALLLLVYAAGTGLGGYQVLDDTLLTLQIPRVSGGRILPGATELWRSLANKFGLSYEVLQRLLPTLAGLAAGLLLILAALMLARVLSRRAQPRPSAGALALLLFFGLGALLSPTALLGNANAVNCGGDVIASYEAAGQALAEEVPPGAQIYWAGGLSPVPLLYLPGVRIYPPQLNGSYSISKNTNSDLVYRRGLWNTELSAKWLREADYVLVEDRTYRGNLRAVLDPQKYNELTPTPAVVTCREGSRIRVFRREK